MAQFILDTSQLDQDVLGPVVFAAGSAELGGLLSAATALVENVVTATASLGGLTATANQFIPTPEPSGGGGRNKFDTDRHLVNLRRPRPVPEPEIVITPEVKITVVVKGRARATSKIQATADSRISFSILDDDAELLALL